MRTKEFTIHRVLVARMAAEAYARLFWWFILPGPLFGVVMIAAFSDPMIKAIGALGCVWPATIPFRAYLITSKMARARYSHPTTVIATDESLLFLSEESKYKADYVALRNAYILHGMVVLNTKRYALMLVPLSAFDESNSVQKFMKILGSQGVRINQKSVLEL